MSSQLRSPTEQIPAWRLISKPSAQDPNLLHPKPSISPCKEITSIDESIAELLEHYSKIPRAEQLAHVRDIRARAHAAHPLPSLASSTFPATSLPSHPYYPTLLSRLQHGALLLDLGTGLGTSLRHLIHASVPSAQLFGLDLRPDLIDAGYDLFRDRESLRVEMLVCDFDDWNTDLSAVQGRVDVVHAGFFFDGWSKHSQLRLLTKVANLVRKCEGSVVLGTQRGSDVSREVKGEEVEANETDWEGEKKAWLHSVESWREMWERAGERAGARWRVSGGMRDGEVEGERVLWWVAIREEL